MDTFKQHEQFEMEVLEKLHSTKVLAPLVFGGGAMLRLCHELNRYSADFDFWFLKDVEHHDYFNKIKQVLQQNYDVEDVQIKHHTLVFAIKSRQYPKPLKIEIRKKEMACDYQQKIAFSKFGFRQVLLNAHTLEHTMMKKVEAVMDRAEIRDCFDIEFMLRRGVDLPSDEVETLRKIEDRLNALKKMDYAVKLAPILEKEMRDYYVSRGFAYLREKLHAVTGCRETVHKRR